MAYDSVLVSAGSILFINQQFFENCRIPGAVCVLSLLRMNNWERHYLVRRLARQNPTIEGAAGWQQIGQEINVEMRQPLLYTLANKGPKKTNKLIIKCRSLCRLFTDNCDGPMDFEGHKLQCGLGANCRFSTFDCPIRFIKTGFIKRGLVPNIPSSHLGHPWLGGSQQQFALQ